MQSEGERLKEDNHSSISCIQIKNTFDVEVSVGKKSKYKDGEGRVLTPKVPTEGLNTGLISTFTESTRKNE